MHVDRLLLLGNGVASVADLAAAGISRQVIANRVRVGRWQRPLPRVVVAHSGPLTDDQRRRAVLVYGGSTAVLSHSSAGVMVGLRVVEDDVHVSVRHGVRRPSISFAVVHQTRSELTRQFSGGLPCTTAARTVVDIACSLQRLNDVRALVADSIQRGLTTVVALEREMSRAPRHRPAFLRQAVEEVTAGARSAGEAEFLQIIRRAGLPMPQLNAPITVDGQRFRVDALWSDCKVVVEIDGRAWHVKAGQWERDLERQNLLHAAGYIVLRFPMRRLFEDPAGVVAEVRTVLIDRGGLLA